MSGKRQLGMYSPTGKSLSPGLYVRLGKAGRDLQTTVSSNYCFQIFFPLVLVITFTHSAD